MSAAGAEGGSERGANIFTSPPTRRHPQSLHLLHHPRLHLGTENSEGLQTDLVLHVRL